MRRAGDLARSSMALPPGAVEPPRGHTDWATLKRLFPYLWQYKLRVVGALGILRNSIGPDGYVSDEIIRSHAGVRVRIGNTELRFVIGDATQADSTTQRVNPDPWVESDNAWTEHDLSLPIPESPTPEARRQGPVQPQFTASAPEIAATPTERSSQMRFLSTKPSTSSRNAGMISSSL